MRLTLLHIARLALVFAFGVFLSSAFNYLVISRDYFRGQMAEAVPMEPEMRLSAESDTPTPVLREEGYEPYAATADPAADVAETAVESNDPVVREVTTTARRGDTLLSFLRRGGIEAQEAFEISNVLKGEVKTIRTGQRMDVTLERSPENPEVLAFKGLKLLYPEKQVQVARNDKGALEVEAIAKPLKKDVVRAGTAIYGSLMGAAEEVGIPASVMQSVINAYSYDVDFQREVMAGDRFEVVYESLRDEDGRHVRSGDVLYAQLTLSGKPRRIYYYTDQSGQAAFYTEDGKSVKRALLKTPINGARVSSGFGMRMHPVLGYSKMHRGVDFAAPIGTPIYAAGDGRVVEAGRKGSYGNYVRIRHNGEYSTAYAHLNRFARGLKVGSRVKQGQVIAYVGNTGRSTGPHLHFEVMKGSRQINPGGVKSLAAGGLNKREMARFKRMKAQLQQTVAQLPMQTQVAALR